MRKMFPFDDVIVDYAYTTKSEFVAAIQALSYTVTFEGVW